MYKGVYLPSELSKKVLTRIDGKIYDLTDFVSLHPGGNDPITSLHNRDATIPFLHTHSRDKNAQLLLKKYLVKDPKVIEEAERQIPKMQRVDQRLVDLYRRCEGLSLSNRTFLLIRPVVIMAIGVYLLFSSTQWSSSWALGVLAWSYALFDEINLSHNMTHYAVFDSAKKNRQYNDFHAMLITGFSGRLAYREHYEHHFSTNILGMDPALEIPVKWRDEAEMMPLYEKVASVVGQGFIFSLGSLLAFPWTTMANTVSGLVNSRMRLQHRLYFVCWVVRNFGLLALVGPTAMILSYMIPLAIVGFEATSQHFDQPVFLPEEYYQAAKEGMLWAEHQIRSIRAYHATDIAGIPITTVAIDHVYHHYLPNMHDSYIPQSVKDEVDQVGVCYAHYLLYHAFIY